jgi:transcription antitermination factor NusG
MQGKVCTISAEGNRIGVLLNIFDRETSVELDILEIEKVL